MNAPRTALAMSLSLSLAVLVAACGDVNTAAPASGSSGGSCGESRATDAPPVGSTAVAASEASAGSADLPVEITIRRASGDYDAPRFRELMRSFEATHPGITVVVDDHPDTWTGALAPIIAGTDDAPTIALTDPGLLLGLADSDAIVALPTGCLTDADIAASEQLLGPVGMVDGQRYGIPLGVQTELLAYDAGALAAAGVAAPPATLDEVEAVARALRDAGYRVPMLWPSFGFGAAMGGAPWSDADPSPVDAAGRAQLERGAALVRDELLFVEPPSDLPRYLSGVGSGEVAMAVLDVGLLWALADGLAAGQAPDLDLRVAPVPGPDGASVPTGSYVYVISATASDAERAGATDLLHWLLEPAQQGQLHQFTDLFPVDPSAADDPSLVEYWGQLPLLGAAFDVLVEHATPGMHEPLLPWPDRMRAGGTIHDALVVADAALAVQRLDELRVGVEDYFADPARWLACISAAGTVACGPGDPAPIPFDD